MSLYFGRDFRHLVMGFTTHPASKSRNFAPKLAVEMGEPSVRFSNHSLTIRKHSPLGTCDLEVGTSSLPNSCASDVIPTYYVAYFMYLPLPRVYATQEASTAAISG